MTPAPRTRFRPRQHVKLSLEGREKQIARADMKGVVVRQAGPLVTIFEDGAGIEADYHEDYLEHISRRA